MAEKVLSADSLRKVFGDLVAVDDVSFDVAANEIVGLLGPNGAGKTTIINMILGTLGSTAGSVKVNGMDLRLQRSAILKRTNFAAVYAPLPGNLTAYENLHIFALLYGVQDPRQRIEELLKRFDLEKFRNTKSGVLSSGEQTRLSLAKAMLNDPDLLLLDEPTASLDPAIARDIRATIREFAAGSGCAVLWTSHNMHEIEAMCDRVLFLSHGTIILSGDPRALPQEYHKANLEELFIMAAREPLSLKEK